MSSEIPAPAFTTTPDEPAAACGAVRCQQTANLAVDLLTALVEDLAKAHDGWVPIDELRSLFDQFKMAPGELGRFYERTYDDCIASHNELSLHEFDQWDAFDHLLAEALSIGSQPSSGDDSVRQDEGRIPPRAIPPLIRTISCLLGRGFVRRSRTACAELEHKARERHGNDFSWKRFAQGSAAKALLLRTIVRLGDVLGSPAAGSHRVVEMVNTDLGNLTVVSGVYQPGPPIIFSETQYRQALEALFGGAPDMITPDVRRSASDSGAPVTAQDLQRLNAFCRQLAV